MLYGVFVCGAGVDLQRTMCALCSAPSARISRKWWVGDGWEVHWELLLLVSFPPTPQHKSRVLRLSVFVFPNMLEMLSKCQEGAKGGGGSGGCAIGDGGEEDGARGLGWDRLQSLARWLLLTAAAVCPMPSSRPVSVGV